MGGKGTLKGRLEKKKEVQKKKMPVNSEWTSSQLRCPPKIGEEKALINIRKRQIDNQGSYINHPFRKRNLCRKDRNSSKGCENAKRLQPIFPRQESGLRAAEKENRLLSEKAVRRIEIPVSALAVLCTCASLSHHEFASLGYISKLVWESCT